MVPPASTRRPIAPLPINARWGLRILRASGSRRFGGQYRPEPFANSRDIGEAKRCTGPSGPDFHGPATRARHHREAEFVGTIVADEHWQPSGKRRLGHEFEDCRTLVPAIRPNLQDALARLQPQSLAPRQLRRAAPLPFDAHARRGAARGGSAAPAYHLCPPAAGPRAGRRNRQARHAASAVRSWEKRADGSNHPRHVAPGHAGRRSGATTRETGDRRRRACAP